MSETRSRRVVSGMRPTGLIHVGHFEGVIRNWLTLQDSADCRFFVADLHALTDRRSPEEIGRFTREMILDFLALGIDPEKAVIFVQSQVPAHAELATLLSMTVPVSWLERCPTYKDRVGELGEGSANLGLLMYPVLMASDVALYDADSIPVGEDQIPHLELAREVVRKFNSVFPGADLVEPKPLLARMPKLPGTDGRKMSKSYDNTIDLSKGPENLRKRVMSMITDPARVKRNDPGHPEVCNVFEYHGIYSPGEISAIEADCRSATLGCVDCKKNLAARMIASLETYWERRRDLEARKGRIEEVIEEGRRRCEEAAAVTMERIRRAVGLLAPGTGRIAG